MSIAKAYLSPKIRSRRLASAHGGNGGAITQMLRFRRFVREHAAAVAFLVLCLVVLLWRAGYGFDWTDESFYVANAYRIVQGDQLFKEMWNVDQLAALQYAPLVALYRVVTGGTDGIILFLRMGYVTASVLVAFLVFLSIHTYMDDFWAILVSLPVILCANPVTFSYNNLRMLTYFATCALLVIAKRQESHTARYALFGMAGFIYTCGVLAYPSSLLTAPVFVAWVVLPQRDSHSAALRELVACIAGGLLCSALLLIFILVNSSLDALAFFVQRQMELHRTGGRTLLAFVQSLAHLYGRYSLLWLVIACLVACGSRHYKLALPSLCFEIIFWISLAILAGLQAERCSVSFGNTAQQHRLFFAVSSSLPALFCFYGRMQNDITCCFVLGLVASYVVYMSTGNDGIEHSVYPMALSASATVSYVGMCSGKASHFSACVARTLYGVVLASVAMAALCYVYRDAPLPTLSTPITIGPAAGLHTTPNNEQQYRETVQTISKDMPQEGNVLFVNLLPFGYLCTDARVAAWGTWSVELDDERVEQYYGMNPDRLPQAIYYVNEHYGWPGKNGNLEMGTYFRNYFNSSRWRRTEYPCGVVVSIRDYGGG